jgi:hypothetical protein
VPEGSLFYKEVKFVADFFISEAITRKINRRPADFFKHENLAIFMNSPEFQEFQKSYEYPESAVMTSLRNSLGMQETSLSYLTVGNQPRLLSRGELRSQSGFGERRESKRINESRHIYHKKEHSNNLVPNAG